MQRTRVSLTNDTHVDELRDELNIALADTDRLRGQLEHVMDTNRSLSVLLLNSDTRSGELLKQLIAVRALIESRNAAAALAGLEDVLVNVVGTEDYLIYALDTTLDALVPIASQGDAFISAQNLPMAGSWLGDVVRAGEVLIAHGRPSSRRTMESKVAAVVPLCVGDRVLGAIVIGRVMPHRESLDVCDREILRLLGAYAATAIIAADRRSEWSQLPAVLQ